MIVGGGGGASCDRISIHEVIGEIPGGRKLKLEDRCSEEGVCCSSCKTMCFS